MQDPGAEDATDAVVVSQAYSAARELLRQAEEDAARIRADADAYLRRREQEAELLVGKARRVLEMAELRAAAPQLVDAVASAVPSDVPSGPAVAPAPPAADGRAPDRSAPNALDSILAAAVSNAVHRALPADD
jgi:hypothetical protein